MRIFLTSLVLASLACPRVAGAQSYFALRADLRDARARVGTIGGAPVTLVRWEDRRRARVHLETSSVALEGTIDVRAEGTHVVAGVGEDVAIAGGPWAITMLAGTWAPLAERGEGERARVLLPAGLPMRRGTLARAAAPAWGSPPTRAFVHGAIDWDRWEPACRGITIRAGAAGGPRRWLAAGSLVHVSGSRAPFAIDAWVDGFVLHGHADARPTGGCGAGMAAGPLSARGCMGSPRGELRRVPAGTSIRAGGAALATPRVDVVGRLQGDLLDVMHVEATGASWEIVGTVDDLAALAPVDAVPDDMRSCWTVADGWPEDG